MAERVLGAHPLREEDHLHGDAERDVASETLRLTAAGDDPALRCHGAEGGIRAGDAQVAAQGEGQAGGKAVAVDGGDDRLPDALGSEAAPTALLAPIVGDILRALHEVASRTKGLFASAGDDRDQESIVVLELVPCFAELAVHFRIDAVHRLRAVERDEQCAVAAFGADGHGT